MWRRTDAAGGQAARGHGPRRPLAAAHRFDGLRATANGRELDLPWPAHPVYPAHGYVVRRRELDTLVAKNAEAAGAVLLEGTDALGLIVERGFVRGASVQRKDEAAPRGARPLRHRRRRRELPRFGRARHVPRVEWPYGTAIRTYWESPRHAEPWIESALDVKDRNGNPLPGYGWVFPVGDGTVNIGVGLLSTFRDFKSVNTSHLLDSCAHMVAEQWEIRPTEPARRRPAGDCPWAAPSSPKSGPTCRGRRRRHREPLQRRRHRLRLETGRLAADTIHTASARAIATVLLRCPRRLHEEYGQYFKVARLFAQVIGRPALMRELTRVGMRSHTLMEWVLRIMANLMRPEEVGPA